MIRIGLQGKNEKNNSPSRVSPYDPYSLRRHVYSRVFQIMIDFRQVVELAIYFQVCLTNRLHFQQEWLQ